MSASPALPSRTARSLAALGCLGLLLTACGHGSGEASRPVSAAPPILGGRGQLHEADIALGQATPPPLTASYTAVFHISIPSIGVEGDVIAVGVKDGAMDAPFGSADSPVWHQGFWLAAGAQPGVHGTTTIAGHVDDILARPGIFWRLREIAPGAIVSVTRMADGVTVRYRIEEARSFPDKEANSPAVIHRLYGPPGGGTDDGIARISLITCTGTFHAGSGFDHRFIAFGERI